MRHKTTVFLLTLAGIIGLIVMGVLASLGGHDPIMFGKAESSARVLPLEAAVEEGDKHIHGQVIYQQAVALPPQATLLLQLVDASDPDGGQKIIMEQRSVLAEHPPFSFTLPFDIRDLPQEQPYALKARISVGDSLWFANNPPLRLEPEKLTYLIHLEKVVQSRMIPAVPTGIEGRQWIAEEIDNQKLVKKSLITLTIDDDPFSTGSAVRRERLFERHTVTGSGGCNRYFSTVILNKKQEILSFEPIGMTFMLCDEAISYQEQHFVDMMSRVRHYHLDASNLLYFLDDSKQVIARFTAKN